MVLRLRFSTGVSPTLRTFTAFLVAVVLAVILPVANEALVDAEAVLTVVARRGAKQRVCGCEGNTTCHQRGQQVTLNTLGTFPSQEHVLLGKQ